MPVTIDGKSIRVCLRSINRGRLSAIKTPKAKPTQHEISRCEQFEIACKKSHDRGELNDEKFCRLLDSYQIKRPKHLPKDATEKMVLPKGVYETSNGNGLYIQSNLKCFGWGLGKLRYMRPSSREGLAIDSTDVAILERVIQCGHSLFGQGRFDWLEAHKMAGVVFHETDKAQGNGFHNLHTHSDFQSWLEQKCGSANYCTRSLNNIFCHWPNVFDGKSIAYKQTKELLGAVERYFENEPVAGLVSDTRKNIRTNFNHVMLFAEELELISINPLSSRRLERAVEVKLPKENKTKGVTLDEVLTKAELKEIWSRRNELKDSKDYLPFLLCMLTAATGLRPNELNALCDSQFHVNVAREPPIHLAAHHLHIYIYSKYGYNITTFSLRLWATCTVAEW